MNDDLLLNNEECPSIFDSSQFNPLDIFPSTDDVLSLTKQVEHLSLEVNTQGLKAELERLKRRRLGTTLKRVRQETIPIRKMLAQAQNENTTLKEQVNATSHIHYSEQTRLGVLTHCCESRIHQILISVIPHVQLSPGEHHGISQLTYELLRAAQQIKSPYFQILANSFDILLIISMVYPT